MSFACYQRHQCKVQDRNCHGYGASAFDGDSTVDMRLCGVCLGLAVDTRLPAHGADPLVCSGAPSTVLVRAPISAMILSSI